jgi:hypothetical protein
MVLSHSPGLVRSTPGRAANALSSYGTLLFIRSSSPSSSSLGFYVSHLLAGGCTLIPAAIYSISQFFHFLLPGLWGLPWMLVGYVVFIHSGKREQAMLVQARGSNDATMDVPAHAYEWRGR